MDVPTLQHNLLIRSTAQAITGMVREQLQFALSLDSGNDDLVEICDQHQDALENFIETMSQIHDVDYGSLEELAMNSKLTLRAVADKFMETNKKS